MPPRIARLPTATLLLTAQPRGQRVPGWFSPSCSSRTDASITAGSGHLGGEAPWWWRSVLLQVAAAACLAPAVAVLRERLRWRPGIVQRLVTGATVKSCFTVRC